MIENSFDNSNSQVASQIASQVATSPVQSSQKGLKIKAIKREPQSQQVSSLFQKLSQGQINVKKSDFHERPSIESVTKTDQSFKFSKELKEKLKINKTET